MVRILASGEVVADDDLRWKGDTKARRKLPLVAGGVLLAAWLYASQTKDPFEGGLIPAEARGPFSHWAFIQQTPNFVRDMTTHALRNGHGSRGRGSLKEGLETAFTGRVGGIDSESMLKSKGLKDMELLMFADYGGELGAVPEEMDTRNADALAVTRCSTTSFAVTAYFCGIDVANSIPAYYAGVDNFVMFLRHTHDMEPRWPLIYRLGIGSEERSEPSQGHVWSIVALPDGTFHWIQSFIGNVTCYIAHWLFASRWLIFTLIPTSDAGHYSVEEWMKKCERGGEAKLTLSALLAKLDQLKMLQTIDAWTPKANAAYVELFNVDITKTALEQDGFHSWQLSHRLTQFFWDIACEYPTPAGYVEARRSEKDRR